MSMGRSLRRFRRLNRSFFGDCGPSGRGRVTSLTVSVTFSRRGLTVNSTWNGGSGNWSNPADWTPNSAAPNDGTPLDTDYNVSINGGDATLDIDSTVQQLNLGEDLINPGTLTGTNTITVGGVLTTKYGATIRSERQCWTGRSMRMAELRF